MQKLNFWEKAGPNTTPKYEVITAGDHIQQMK